MYIHICVLQQLVKMETIDLKKGKKDYKCEFGGGNGNYIIII